MYNTNKRGNKRPPFTFLGMEKNAVDMLYRKKKAPCLLVKKLHLILDTSLLNWFVMVNTQSENRNFVL